MPNYDADLWSSFEEFKEYREEYRSYTKSLKRSLDFFKEQINQYKKKKREIEPILGDEDLDEIEKYLNRLNASIYDLTEIL